MKKNKVKCPECSEFFVLDDELEDEEHTECPECSSGLLVKISKGKMKVLSELAKFDEMDGILEED